MCTDTTFRSHRPWLFALAYRMLGTATDAEDVLQEAHLRFSEHGAQVQHPKRWLEQVVTRLCLDQLKSARARREEYVGPWLPDPEYPTLGARLYRKVAPELPFVPDALPCFPVITGK